MKKILYYFNKVKKMSFSELFLTIFYVYIKPRFMYLNKLKSVFFSTQINTFRYSLIPFFSSKINLNFSYNKKIFEYVCNKYCNHYFDLLGSGWIKNSFAENSFGFMGYKYPELILSRDLDNKWLEEILAKNDLKKAKEIYVNISSDYIPIDWQKDFKSGFRWSAKTWYLDLQYGNKLGVDIKVPWELSRLQHLVRLSVFFSIDKTEKEYIVKEYENQVMDFIAQNPPCKGVNWRCTMDVGIRTANLAMSYSIMKSSGAVFSSFFERLLAASIYTHCKFIRRNLEWSASCKSNHYLSDVCGLLFGAALLKNTFKGKIWLKFARNEIVKELFLQFHDDGSNFESSVAYHRLSSELIVYSLALIRKLSNEGLIKSVDPNCYDRIYKLGKFSFDTILPDGTLYQCGDNDSGHFFNITPIGDFISTSEVKKKYCNLKDYNGMNDEDLYFDENMNCVDGLLCVINQLINSNFKVKNECLFEKKIINAFCCEYNNYNYIKDKVESVNINFSDFKYKTTKVYSIRDCDLSDLNYKVYPDFGLTIYTAKDIYLAICWSDNGQNGNAGHTHNDKLSYELWIKGNPIIRDPGTFVYTPLPEERNKFRSVNAHSTIITSNEQNDYLSLFSMRNNTRCSLLSLSNNKCSIFLEYGEVKQKRCFSITEKNIIIDNYSNEKFVENYEQRFLTAGYGKLLNFGGAKG